MPAASGCPPGAGELPSRAAGLAGGAGQRITLVRAVQFGEPGLTKVLDSGNIVDSLVV